MVFPFPYQEPASPIICQVREAAAKSAAGILRAAAPELSGPIALGCKRLCLQVTVLGFGFQVVGFELRVQCLELLAFNGFRFWPQGFWCN